MLKAWRGVEVERTGQKRTRRIAAVIIFLLAIGLIQDRARLLLIGQQSLEWPTVVGEVIAAESAQIARSPTGRSWRTRIQYRYRIDGRDYQSARLSFSRQIGGRTRLQADDELRQFVPGGPVVIHYDPLRPHRAVLQPGPDRRAFFGLTVGGGLVIVALLFWTVPTRSGPRRSSAS